MRLPPKLTMAEGAAAVAALQATAAANGPLRIDASALTDFDTAALAVLLHAKRLADERRQPFDVRDPPAQLRKLAQLYGVAGLLQLDGAE